jgi:hypothetical protein
MIYRINKIRYPPRSKLKSPLWRDSYHARVACKGSDVKMSSTSLESTLESGGGRTMEVLTLMLFEAICHNAVMARRMRHQLLAVLLCTGFALLCVQAATAQTKPSDAEMKEVYRLLLEREVQRPADGTNVAVLLGPNVKSFGSPTCLVWLFAN